MRICKVNGCGKKHHGLGFCSRHYRQVKKHGHILPERHFPDKCTIEGCNKKYRAKGFCKSHYEMHLKGTLYRRTRYTPNKIIINGAVAEIVLYEFQKAGKKPSEVARTLIDREDLDKVRGIKFHLDSGYVRTSRKQGKACLHNLIMDNRSLDIHIDHINGDRLDNRKSNLRLATPAENQRNRTKLASNNTSGVTGVYWHISREKWRAVIKCGGKGIHLGDFTSFEDAVAVRKQAEKTYFGEFAPKI